MGLIAAHNAMLVCLWIVLALVGLTIVAKTVTGLRGKLNLAQLAETLTRPILLDIFPLILLSWLTAIDGTHILMLIWYFAAALVIAVRTLMELLQLLRKLV